MSKKAKAREARKKDTKRNIPIPEFKKEGVIPDQEAPKHPGTVLFSFKYLDLAGNEKFHFSRCSPEWLMSLFERLRSVSGMSMSEFEIPQGTALRNHELKWSTTTENGFSGLSEELQPDRPWQFSVSKKKGRVHGFLLHSVFYVVWLDPDHELYD